MPFFSNRCVSKDVSTISPQEPNDEKSLTWTLPFKCLGSERFCCCFERNWYFIHQGHIKLIKVTVKTCIMLQKIAFSNKCSSFQPSIHQRTLDFFYFYTISTTKLSSTTFLTLSIIIIFIYIHNAIFLLNMLTWTGAKINLIKPVNHSLENPTITSRLRM